MPGSRRRWLVRAGVGLAVLAVTIVAAWSWLVPALIARAIAAELGETVTFRSWWIDGRSSGVTGLSVRERGPTSPVWLTVPRVTTDLSLGKVVRGRLRPGRVTLEAPIAVVRLDRQGEWLGRPGGLGKAAAVDPPVLVAQGARVSVRQEGRPAMDVSHLTARLAPDGDALSLAARSSDPVWGPIQVLGKLGPDLVTGHLEMRSGRPIALTPERVATLPFVPPEVWREVSPDGEVDVRLALDLGRFPDGRAARVRIELGLRGATVHSRSLGLAATGTSGTIVVDDALVTLEKTAGQAVGGTVRAQGTLDFGKVPNVFDVDLDLTSVDVADTPSTWQLDELGVTGRLTGHARLHAVLRPETVDLSGSTGHAVVEEGTIQGIPFQSMRLGMSAQGRDLRYDSPHPDDPRSGRGTARERSSGPDGGAPRRGRWSAPAAVVLVGLQTPAPGPPDSPPKVTLPRSLTTHLVLADVEVAELVARLETLLGFPFPLPITGKLSLEADATVPLGQLRDVREYAFHGDLTIKGASVFRVDVGRLSARIDLADGALELTDLRGRLVDLPDGGPRNPPGVAEEAVPAEGPLPAGTFRGTLHAAVDPPGQLTARFEGKDLPVGELAAPALPRPTPLSGLASLDFEARADLKAARDPAAWTASGHASSQRVTHDDARLDQLALRFVVAAGKLEVKELTARLEGQPLEADFHVGLAPPHTFDGHLDVTSWDLARLLAWRPGHVSAPVGGTCSIHAKATGTLRPRRVEAEGQGRLEAFTAGPFAVGDVPFDWMTQADDVVVSVTDAHPFGGTVSARALVPTSPGRPVTGTVKLTEIDTARLAASVPNAQLALAGKASGTLDLSVPADASRLVVSGQLAAPDLSVQGIPAENVRLTLTARRGAIDYEISAASLGGTVELKGGLPLSAREGDLRAEGALRAVGFRFEPLWKARGTVGAIADLSGRGAFDANVRNVFEGPEAGLYTHGIVEFRDLAWRGQTLGRVRATVAGTPDVWRADPIDGELLGGLVSGFFWANPAVGEGGGIARAGYELRVDRAQVETVLGLVPGLPGPAEGAGSLRIQGTGGPSWQANAELLVPNARVAGLDLTELRIPAELILPGGNDPGTVRVRQWTARLAGGQFRGDATFRIGTDRAFDSNLTLANLDLEPVARAYSTGPDPATGRVSGRITLAGPDPATTDRYRGKVDLELTDASIVSLPVFREIDRFLGASRGGLFEQGHLTGTVAGGHLVVEPLTLQGRLAQVHGTGTVGLDGRLDLEVLVSTNQLIPQTGQALLALVPGLGNAEARGQQAYLSVANFLSNRLLKLRVTGTMKEPSVSLDPSITLANTAVSFFAGVLKLPLGLIK